MDKMCRIADEELDRIAEKGLTTSNLDNAYKLSKIKYYLTAAEAMEEGAGSAYAMEDGNSFGRYSSKRRYSGDNQDGMMNSNAYDRYSRAKYDYRHSRSNGNHQMIMDSLEECMVGLTDKLNDMKKDADTPEERQMIDRYLSKIKN